LQLPTQTIAGWLAGRFVLLLVILAALVALDAYRDESSLLTAQLKGLVPDAELIARLESGRDSLADFAAAEVQQINERLRAAQMQTDRDLDLRIAVLTREIAATESRRRTSTQKTLALLTGKGFEEDLRTEIELQLLTAERDALQRLQGQLTERRSLLRTTAQDFERARLRTLQTYDAYLARKAALDRFEAGQSMLGRVPGSAAWRERNRLLQDANRAAREYDVAGTSFYVARGRLAKARSVSRIEAELVESAGAAILTPLEDLIAAKRATLESAERQAERIQRTIRKVFVNALLILVLVTLAPVGIKAFWYFVVAPAASRRPPIRLRASAGGVPDVIAADLPDKALRAKFSAVSQEIRIGEHEELLVHPDFLQSSADRGRKDTKWVLDWGYPLTSLAAGMVALTRIRGAGAESVVVSSKTDPFAEVGVLELPEGASLVLQPRNLVGVVQKVGRPIWIARHWRFGLGAWITFQFRYLVFEGPGRLIVQGCRGVRIEAADRGRSIDQGATIGFSANLDYSRRRSETFGAYLMGMRGLFNDNFSGGPGYYVYEEMPYFGKKVGITGRGLEGLTDGLLKVFGI
jgi:uncharacterized protein (AIM24 family)